MSKEIFGANHVFLWTEITDDRIQYCVMDLLPKCIVLKIFKLIKPGTRRYCNHISRSVRIFSKETLVIIQDKDRPGVLVSYLFNFLLNSPIRRSLGAELSSC